MGGLTNEDYVLMGWLDNPRFNYKKQMQRLKKVHNFTFDARKKLTPQRKTAIRKAFNKYNSYVSKIDSGKYSFIPAKKAQVKNLSEQFPHSNKGIIYNHPIQEGAKRKTKIFGIGKQTKLVDETVYTKARPELKGIKEYTFYLPFPIDLQKSMREIWIDYINDTLKPHLISVAINGYSGLAGKLPESASKYAVDLMDKIGKKGKEILTGIYIIFHTKKGGAWLLKKEQQIKLLY